MGQANLICCCAAKDKDRGHFALSQRQLTEDKGQKYTFGLEKPCHELPADSDAGVTISSADNGIDHEENPDEALTRELQALAVKLSRAVHKYPSKGKSYRKPQLRYLAILPSYEDQSRCLLQRYEHGWLAYWETELSYAQGLQPRGYVCLLRIAKIHHERTLYQGKGVVVRHNRGDKDSAMEELVLLLESRRDASEFSHLLWEFLAKLRGEWEELQRTRGHESSAAESSAAESF